MQDTRPSLTHGDIMKAAGTLINDVAAARLRILQLVDTLSARQAAFKLNQIERLMELPDFPRN